MPREVMLFFRGSVQSCLLQVTEEGKEESQLSGCIFDRAIELSVVVNCCRGIVSLKTNCENKNRVFLKGQREQLKKVRPSEKI